MKTKYPSMFGLLVALMLVVSFVLPTNLVSPSAVSADPGICKWDILWTPGSLPFKGDIQNTGGFGNELIDMAVGGDSGTIVWVIKGFQAVVGTMPSPPGNTVRSTLALSVNNGLTLSGTPNANLLRAGQVQQGWSGIEDVYLVAIAPDDPKFWAVATDAAQAFPGGTAPKGPRDVWVTRDNGSSWQWAGAIPYTDGAGAGTEMIRTIDVSTGYGGGRDIAIGTTDAAANNVNSSNIYVVKSIGFGSWLAQLAAPPRIVAIDFEDIKFSPTYGADASLVVAFSDNLATWFNIAFRDIARNVTTGWHTPGGPLAVQPNNGIEVRDPGLTLNDSPGNTSLNNACIALPSDFNGRAASLRRAYISLDSWNGLAKTTDPAATNSFDGIFRIDDTVVYTLMATWNNITKSIYSIAYFGTYASGKLLAGERMGFPCTATVPTWFTDSPTTCPIPCWYPALKPTTGAAAVALLCPTTQTGPGGAIVGWKADGGLAYVSTSSALRVPVNAGGGWFQELWGKTWALLPGDPVNAAALLRGNDESAFAISRNNGETWNQLAYIDTTITRLVDVAPTPDCKTIYLASVNGAGTPAVPLAAACTRFDSVWRSSVNNEVVAPLPPRGLGTDWERVLCRVTAPDCSLAQVDAAILRIVPYCADPTGQIVAWAVYDNASQYNIGVAVWSPDYGDYWAEIYPRNPVQDFCFESATVMYFLTPNGLVQKMPYNGTSWANTLDSVSALLPGMHTIAAYPEGRVLVGADNTWSNLYAGAYSANFNTDTPSFATIALAGVTAARGSVHVAFDTNFEDTNTIFIGDDDLTAGAGLGGSVYRNSAAGAFRWADMNMMSALCGATGSLAPHEVGQYGIAIAFTGADGQCALYSAHQIAAPALNSGVCRTLWPLNGMPKPGIIWDCLSAGLPPAGATNVGVVFTREPSSLKICGCCTLDTDTTLYAIDDRAYNPFEVPATARRGMLWGFTDCLSKKGPALITEDKSLIGCDPVSGRAQEVNLCWEQLCIANAYDIEIAKLEDFSIRIVDWVRTGNPPVDPLNQAGWEALFLSPADVMIPCAYFPAGGTINAIGTNASQIASWGNLECGHTYYWRVQVRECATSQIVRSPWSEIRSFTVKAGLPVTTPYYGPQLLAPNNGCLGCPVSPASFSWSPFKETTKYKFVLASDAAMTQIVKEAEVATTAFEYDGTLEYSTNYFWRIMSMEPAPSDWSATFSFQTEAAAPAAPPADQAPPTPLWVWVVIAIGAILVIVTLVLIFKTRRV